jgi:hypothetical protein
VEQASLVLTALAIPHAVEHAAGGWQLLVETTDETRARQPSRRYAASGRRPPPS